MLLRLVSVLMAVLLAGGPARGAGGENAENPAPTETNFTLQCPYHTEEEYIVGSVCRNAYEMLSFMVDKKGEIIPPEKVSVRKIAGDTTSYAISLESSHGKIEVTLTWPGSIWDSQPYVPFCQAAMSQLKIKPQAGNSPTQGNPLGTLLAFDEKSIEAENDRISKWLTAEPENALAQQQAALVLGTLAMKANSGWFWDPRDICNHATAHLAVARALSSSPELGVEGQLAECLVGLIVDTKKECSDEIERLAKIAFAPKELDSWLRAARVRNSRDWRLIDKPESANGLEQVEFFRAYAEAISPNQAAAWLQKNSIADRPDWGRIIMEIGPSVETGHIYCQSAIDSDLAVARDVLPNHFLKESMVIDLNDAPGDVLSSGGGVRVIGNGMWAQYFQRQICEDIVMNEDFLKNLWSVPDEASRFQRSADDDFSGLSLYPYVQEALTEMSAQADHSETLASAFTHHPEWAPDWIYILPKTTPIDSVGFHAMLQAWFTPAIPSGTAYCGGRRLYNVGADLKKQPAVIDKLFAIAPLQFGMAETELQIHHPDGATFDDVKKVMGPLTDYYIEALDFTVKAKDITPDARLSLEQKATTLDPNRFWYLATDLKDQGRNSEAADAFQRYFDLGTDRVAVANSMDWLVNYYFDHDEKDKAMVIATDCADVYSYDGLRTMMKLQTRLKNFDEAEQYGEKIKKRYDDASLLIVFYMQRVDAGDAAYQSKLDSELSGTFPDGLKKVTIISFSGDPSTGIRFSQETPALQQLGITTHTVVVALDGYKVGNMAQYTMVRAFTDSPAMTFIVWDGTGYHEVKATRPGRKFGVELVNYSH